MKAVKRLFGQFCPTHYSIDLDIDHSSKTFSGQISISGERKDLETNYVHLHSKGLKIASVAVNSTECLFKTKKDTLEIEMPPELRGSSRIDIRIDYSGRISTGMHGIYYSKSLSGSEIVATQFESHHAREAFPCIDEPEAKATFALSLNASLPVKISNTPARSQTKSLTRFAKTPPMSTYLLAFVIGDFQRVSTTTTNGTLVSIWSTKDHDIESLVFPLEVAVKATEFLNDYFETPYPLEKCDHVAIPDFPASVAAMENWGIITYNEGYLLADPDTISLTSKERIAITMAHEISHQWFGNLVTMRWWDDLWLNESFATLMEYLVIDGLYPDWNVMESFAAHEAMRAAERDILPGVQSVAMEVKHPDEINTLFDGAIVYAKGACLLYMLYNLVGNTAFKRGLKEYFKRFAYKNTCGNDLWEVLSYSSNINIKAIMQIWLSQPGMPYLNVSKTVDGTVEITQKQLLSDGSISNQLWPIPLWPNKPISVHMLKDESATITNPPDNLLFNTIGGHYAVHYEDTKALRHFLQDVRKENVATIPKLLMLNDLFLLAQCGIGSITEAMGALEAYSSSSEESVWSIIASIVGELRMMVEDDPRASELLRQYVYRLVREPFERLGFEKKDEDTNNDKKTRAIICGLAVYSGDKRVIEKALVYQLDGMDSIEKMPSDSRQSILVAHSRFGDDSVVRRLLEMYPKIANSDIQDEVVVAICKTHRLRYVDDVLEMLKNDSFVRLQDVQNFIYLLLSNYSSRIKTWNWIVDNWKWIYQSFKGDMSYDNIPKYVSNVFSTSEMLYEYKTMFVPLLSDRALKRNIEMGIKDIESRILWRQRDENDVKDWLSRAISLQPRQSE